MEIVVDNQIANMLLNKKTEVKGYPHVFSSIEQISLRWPSFLECLGIGSIMSGLPLFDEKVPLFQAIVSTLFVTEEKEVVLYLYDHLFAQMLNQIKALPQINASFLLQAIEEKTGFIPLEKYKTAFIEKTADTMHDLILYLAWDRMCVSVGRLFSYPTTDPKFIQGLAIFKECLLESYRHISEQKRTVPSFYRLVEALFFYQMREENLQKHSESQWSILTQSFPVLQAEEKLPDFFYIDDVIASKVEDLGSYWVVDTPDRVRSRLALMQSMLDIIQVQFADWDCVLHRAQIFYESLQEKSSQE